MDKEKKKKFIPLHKKFWYSITKFERYPEMASEGVGRAFGYLAWLIFMFALIFAIGLIIKTREIAIDGIEYLDTNFSEINYEGGNLSVSNIEGSSEIDYGRVKINTNELTSEQANAYKNSPTAGTQFIWLSDKAIAKNGENSFEIYYRDVLDGFGLKQFNKAELINFLNKKINSPEIYISYGIAMIIYTFLAYFISTLIDILILSFFGWITTIIAKLQMRYRAVFNMSVHSVTISVVLQLIYMYIKLFTDFTIKYFDLMYTTISFICLAAAIFMIKSDVIKQQLELMKVIEIRRMQQEEKEEEKEKEEEENEDEEQEEKKEENKEEPKDKEKGQVEGDAQGEGFNA